MLQHWSVNPDQGLNKLLEIFLYFTVGGLTGWLVTRQERERKRYQVTATLLEQSLQEQRQQAQQLIKTEENLRVADRMAVLGELTASLAHEIRNPLGSIKGSANLLANNNLEEHERTEVADILKSEADRMNQVVENYLGAARGRDVEKHTFALNEVCDSINELIREKARKGGIQFDISLPEKPVTLNMNMNQLYQILLNLVLNAIDAMPHGGTIHMQSACSNGALQIEITDEGTGIPEGKIDKIWETFYTTKKEGTGLGLPIVKRIVEENNGEIHLESTKGKGTTVELTLPLGVDS
jgi:signal transduction histidine kinase